MYSLGTDRTESIVPSSSSVVALHVVYRPLRISGFLFYDVIACLPYCNIATYIFIRLPWHSTLKYILSQPSERFSTL
jgi:hypothetical protein